MRVVAQPKATSSREATIERQSQQNPTCLACIWKSRRARDALVPTSSTETIFQEGASSLWDSRRKRKTMLVPMPGATPKAHSVVLQQGRHATGRHYLHVPGPNKSTFLSMCNFLHSTMSPLSKPGWQHRLMCSALPQLDRSHSLNNVQHSPNMILLYTWICTWTTVPQFFPQRHTVICTNNFTDCRQLFFRESNKKGTLSFPAVQESDSLFSDDKPFWPLWPAIWQLKLWPE